MRAFWHGELDDGAIAARWLAAPVHRDEREETMLDFVPLARPERQVANCNWNLELVGERAWCSRAPLDGAAGTEQTACDRPVPPRLGGRIGSPGSTARALFFPTKLAPTSPITLLGRADEGIE